MSLMSMLNGIMQSSHHEKACLRNFHFASIMYSCGCFSFGARAGPTSSLGGGIGATSARVRTGTLVVGSTTGTLEAGSPELNRRASREDGRHGLRASARDASRTDGRES